MMMKTSTTGTCLVYLILYYKIVRASLNDHYSPNNIREHDQLIQVIQFSSGKREGSLEYLALLFNRRPGMFHNWSLPYGSDSNYETLMVAITPWILADHAAPLNFAYLVSGTVTGSFATDSSSPRQSSSTGTSLDSLSCSSSAYSTVLSRNRLNQSRMIIDFIPFGYDVDKLEIRLAESYDYVDIFVIYEAPRTQSGLKKPTFFSTILQSIVYYGDGRSNEDAARRAEATRIPTHGDTARGMRRSKGDTHKRNSHPSTPIELGYNGYETNAEKAKLAGMLVHPQRSARFKQWLPKIIAITATEGDIAGFLNITLKAKMSPSYIEAKKRRKSPKWDYNFWSLERSMRTEMVRRFKNILDVVNSSSWPSSDFRVVNSSREVTRAGAGQIGVESGDTRRKSKEHVPTSFSTGTGTTISFSSILRNSFIGSEAARTLRLLVTDQRVLQEAMASQNDADEITLRKTLMHLKHCEWNTYAARDIRTDGVYIPTLALKKNFHWIHTSTNLRCLLLPTTTAGEGGGRRRRGGGGGGERGGERSVLKNYLWRAGPHFWPLTNFLRTVNVSTGSLGSPTGTWRGEPLARACPIYHMGLGAGFHLSSGVDPGEYLMKRCGVVEELPDGILSPGFIEAGKSGRITPAMIAEEMVKPWCHPHTNAVFWKDKRIPHAARKVIEDSVPGIVKMNPASFPFLVPGLLTPVQAGYAYEAADPQWTRNKCPAAYGGGGGSVGGGIVSTVKKLFS